MSPRWKLTLAAVASGYIVAMSPIFIGNGWTDRTKALVGFAGVAIVLIAGRPLICHERSPIGLPSSPATPRQGQMRTHPAHQNTTTDSEIGLFDGLPTFATDDHTDAPSAPEGVDPATGEVLNDQPAGSAGSEPERPTPSPCAANNPVGSAVEPVAALALGTPVRWATATRTGLGQIVDIGVEAAEIRPLWPCASKQVTVELGRIVPISPLELAEALQCSPTA